MTITETDYCPLTGGTPGPTPKIKTVCPGYGSGGTLPDCCDRVGECSFIVRYYCPHNCGCHD